MVATAIQLFGLCTNCFSMLLSWAMPIASGSCGTVCGGGAGLSCGGLANAADVLGTTIEQMFFSCGDIVMAFSK